MVILIINVTFPTLDNKILIYIILGFYCLNIYGAFGIKKLGNNDKLKSILLDSNIGE